MNIRLGLVFALTLLAGCSRLGEPAPVTFNGAAPAPSAGHVPGYTVAVGPGETLDSVARRFDVTPDVLMQANRLRSASVSPGQVLIIPPPAGHRVRPADTVAGIAHMYGVDEVKLAAANGLNKPYRMKVGQVLSIPGGIGGPVAVKRATAAPSPSLQMEVEVAPPPRSAISASALPPPPGVASAPLAPPAAESERSQSLPLVAPSSAAAAAAGAAASSPTALAPLNPLPPAIKAPISLLPPPATVTTPEAASAPASPVVSAIVPPPAAAPAQTASAAAAAPHFQKPVRGQVISNFGTDATGYHNDGINIAAAAGTAVEAAEAGTVVYAGNELAGFGNLVLIRHAGGWVTAYGHMASIGVQRGATISKGQTIGAVGQTGSVTSPQLHFEVRQGSKPVDPAPYLAGNG